MTTSLAKIVTERPRACLVAVVVATLLLLPGLRDTRMRPVLEGDLPPTDQRVIDDAVAKSIFPHRDFSLLGIECVEGVFTATCINWLRTVAAAVRRLPGLVTPVFSLPTYDYISAREDTITVAPLIGSDLTDAQVATLKSVVTNDPLLHGRLVSKDGYVTLVYFVLSDRIDQHQAHELLTALQAKFDDGSRHRIHIFATHHLNEEIGLAADRDISFLLPIAFLGIAFFVYAVTSTWQAMLLVVTVIGVAIVWCYGAMGVAGVPHSVLTGLIPILLMTVVSSPNYHLIARMRAEYARYGDVTQAVYRSLAALAAPMAVTAAITAAGFASLMTFDIASIREFGWFAAAGVIAGFLTTVLLGSALTLVWWPAVASQRRRRLGQIVDRCTARILTFVCAIHAKHRRTTIAVVASFVVLSIVGVSYIRVGTSPPFFFPRNSELRRGYDALQTHFGGNGFLTVIVDSGERDGIVKVPFLERILTFQRRASEERGVVFASSVVDTVLMRMNRLVNENQPTMETLPHENALVAQYLLLYESGASETLHTLVDFDQRFVAVDALVDANDSADLDRLYDAWARLAPAVFAGTASTIMGGENFIWGAQNDYIVRGKVWNLATTSIWILAVCAFAFRSMSAGVVCAVPVALSTLGVFGLMGFMGTRLDLASCLVTSIVVGVGGDYAVHLVASIREHGAEETNPHLAIERGVREGGQPILYDCVSNLAFLAFIGSSFEPIRSLGWLISVSMVVAACTTLIVVPIAIDTVRPAFLKGRGG